MTDSTENQNIEQQQNQEQNQEQAQQENTTPFLSIEEYKNQIRRSLYILFNKDNFLGTQYFLTNCLNDNLEIPYQHLLNHQRIKKLYLSGEQKDINNRLMILEEEIVKCELINYNKALQVVSPQFPRERNTIILHDLNVSQLEEFQKFIEESELYKVIDVTVKPKNEGEQATTSQVPNLQVIESYDGKALAIQGYNEQITQQCFQWLFTQAFAGSKLTNIQMTEQNYYNTAYFKIFNKRPTGFKPRFVPPPQQFIPMYPPMFQQPQQFGGRGYHPKQGYQKNYNNRNYNNNNNNQVQGYHQGNRRHFNNNQNNNQNYNRYPNQKGGNRNFQNKKPYYNNRNNNQYHHRKANQSNVNVNDIQQFPDLLNPLPQQVQQQQQAAENQQQEVQQEVQQEQQEQQQEKQE